MVPCSGYMLTIFLPGRGPYNGPRGVHFFLLLENSPQSCAAGKCFKHSSPWRRSPTFCSPYCWNLAEPANPWVDSVWILGQGIFRDPSLFEKGPCLQFQRRFLCGHGVSYPMKSRPDGDVWVGGGCGPSDRWPMSGP